MKIGRLVNEKVLVTFLCSMISLLALSSILSHIDVDKDTKKAKASISELEEKKEIKVDFVDIYSKNILTIEEKPVEIVEEEPVQEVQPTVTVVETPPAVTGSVAEYQQYAYSQFGRYGWSEEDFNSLVNLWNRESGWNPTSGNSSGAYGIPQALPASKMSSYGEDYLTNYATQINWGLDYISARYGSPSVAWNNFLTKGWY